jgi:GNAT superfamily N-acetyltransferase
MAAAEIRIRPALTAADAAVHAEYQRLMALETENLPLDMAVTGAGCARALTEPRFGGRVFLAEAVTPATADGQPERVEVAATMMTTNDFDPLRCGAVVWFQSVYVRPEFRRLGIFRKFFAFVAEAARRHGESSPLAVPVVALRLDVEEANERARKTYLAMGMRVEGFTIAQWRRFERLLPAPPPGSVPPSNAQRRPLRLPLSVRRVADPAAVPQLAAMQLASAAAYLGDAATDAATLTRALTRVVADPQATDAELFVVELGDEIVACTLITHEWNDWCDGVSNNSFGTFATSLAHRELRQDAFRALFRFLIDRAEADRDSVDVQCAFNAAIELALPPGERIDAAAREEGMAIQTCLIMRYDL